MLNIGKRKTHETDAEQSKIIENAQRTKFPKKAKSKFLNETIVFT